MVGCQFRRGIGAVDGEYVRIVNPNIGIYDEVGVPSLDDSESSFEGFGVGTVGEPYGADNVSLGDSESAFEGFGVGNAISEI